MYTCIADSHRKVMMQLYPLKDDDLIWTQLWGQFCIPHHEADVVNEKNQSKAWDCLSDAVALWLKCNFEDDVKGKVKPNVDWLIRAVDTVNPQHALKLADEGRPCNMLLFMIIILLCIVYKVKISGLRGHSAQGQLIHI